MRVAKKTKGGEEGKGRVFFVVVVFWLLSFGSGA